MCKAAPPSGRLVLPARTDPLMSRARLQPAGTEAGGLATGRQALVRASHGVPPGTRAPRTPEAACTSSLERHLPPSRPARGGAQGAVAAGPLHGCVRVCLHMSLSGYVWTGSLGPDFPGPDLTLVGGPSERGTGWAAGFPLIKSSWPGRSRSGPARRRRLGPG